MKKFVAFAVMFVMLLGSVSGCGKKDEGDKDKDKDKNGTMLLKQGEKLS